MSPVQLDGAGVAAKELLPLLAQAPWAAGRDLAGVERMLRHSPVQVAARAEGRLVGFARAITDGRYRAIVDDVVVDEAWRGRGLGHDLVLRLLEALDGVEQVRLVCRPDLVPFYDTLGFEPEAATHMRLAQRRGEAGR